jgi:hypothetical protein
MLAALLTAPLAAQAAQTINLQAKTSNDLAELCGANPKEPAADAKINFCHGFAQGVIDMEIRRGGEKKTFCFASPTPTRTATMTEFTNWVRSLPAHRTLGSIDGLLQFLGQRFPCK